MRQVAVDRISDLERYRITAQAIGLVELFGNHQPSGKQVCMAEELIKHLQLSWESCESQKSLIQALNSLK